jgi:hypothetical protein
MFVNYIAPAARSPLVTYPNVPGFAWMKNFEYFKNYSMIDVTYKLTINKILRELFKNSLIIILYDFYKRPTLKIIKLYYNYLRKS